MCSSDLIPMLYIQLSGKKIKLEEVKSIRITGYSGECSADDHADCHIHYISPQNKLFKFLNESAFLAHFSLLSSYGMMVEPHCSTFEPRHSQSRAAALSVTS